MAFAHPETNVAKLGLSNGMKVADIGAGSGLYALAVAPLVGDSGKIYAIDVQQELLSKLKTEAKRQHIHSIETLWANVEEDHGTKLKDGSIDAVILSNVLFQAENRRGLLVEVSRILKDGGKLLLVDWSDSFGGLGPAAKDVVPKDEARALVGAEHLVLLESFNAGDHHYGMIFSKQSK